MTKNANYGFFRFNYKKHVWITFQLKSIMDSYSCLESHLTVISNPMFTSEQQSRN